MRSRVLRAEERVHHIGNFCPCVSLTSEPRASLRLKSRERSLSVFLPPGRDHIRLSPAQGVLERRQPRPRAERPAVPNSGVHIQMALLFKRKRQGVDAVIQMSRANTECRLIHDHAVKGLLG